MIIKTIKSDKKKERPALSKDKMNKSGKGEKVLLQKLEKNHLQF